MHKCKNCETYRNQIEDLVDQTIDYRNEIDQIDEKLSESAIEREEALERVSELENIETLSMDLLDALAGKMNALPLSIRCDLQSLAFALEDRSEAPLNATLELRC